MKKELECLGTFKKKGSKGSVSYISRFESDGGDIKLTVITDDKKFKSDDRFLLHLTKQDSLDKFKGKKE